MLWTPHFWTSPMICGVTLQGLYPKGSGQLGGQQKEREKQEECAEKWNDSRSINKKDILRLNHFSKSWGKYSREKYFLTRLSLSLNNVIALRVLDLILESLPCCTLCIISKKTLWTTTDCSQTYGMLGTFRIPTIYKQKIPISEKWRPYHKCDSF